LKYSKHWIHIPLCRSKCCLYRII